MQPSDDWIDARDDNADARAPRVFMAMPAYLGVQPAAMQALFSFSSRVPGRCCTPKVMPFSHHCGSFNALLAAALNCREEMGLTHFCMHHQDVEPEPWYVDKALDIMDRDGLDVLACAVPIKDSKRMTSVAVLDRDTLHTRRLSVKEVRQLPMTFTKEDLPKLGWKNHLLLPVAGLFFMALDPEKILDERGNSRLWFESPSRIVRDQSGAYISAVWDEGWNISVQMLLAGMSVGCTREIALAHLGGGAWTLDEEAPAAWETDACLTDQSWTLGKCGQSPEKPRRGQKPSLYTPPLLIEEGRGGPC